MRYQSEVVKRTNDMAFLNSLSVVSECFVNKTRFQKLVNSTVVYIPASCAVKLEKRTE